MFSIRECFSHRGSADARLRCASRIHCNQLPTSVLSFVGDFCNEGSPASIVNRLGQHSSRQPFDVQVFDNDCAEVSNEFEGPPMLILISQSPDSSMNLLKQSNSFTSPITAFLTPSGTPLCSPKSCLSLLIPTRIGNLRGVGQRSERLKTYVDTDCVIQSRKQLRLAFNRETGVPLEIPVGLAQNDAAGRTKSGTGPGETRFCRSQAGAKALRNSTV